LEGGSRGNFQGRLFKGYCSRRGPEKACALTEKLRREISVISSGSNYSIFYSVTFPVKIHIFDDFLGFQGGRGDKKNFSNVFNIDH
jgi:hypothetical protein